MKKLEISDLNYCEVVEDNDIKIDGGQHSIISLRLRRIRRVRPFRLFSIKSRAADVLDDFESIEIDSSSKYTINRLNNPATNESGYQIISADGNSTSIVLSSPTSQRSFSSAVSN